MTLKPNRPAPPRRFPKNALLALATVLAAPLPALPQDQSAAAFAAWWPNFQSAVSHRDAKTIARGVTFPLNWENHAIRSIASEAELTARFQIYFTPAIAKIIQKRRQKRGPLPLPNGNYILTWHAAGNEYSLYFKPQGSAFALDGLSEGPP